MKSIDHVSWNKISIISTFSDTSIIILQLHAYGQKKFLSVHVAEHRKDSAGILSLTQSVRQIINTNVRNKQVHLFSEFLKRKCYQKYKVVVRDIKIKVYQISK